MPSWQAPPPDPNSRARLRHHGMVKVAPFLKGSAQLKGSIRVPGLHGAPQRPDVGRSVIDFDFHGRFVPGVFIGCAVNPAVIDGSS